jgi:hypothetical protein
LAPGFNSNGGNNAPGKQREPEASDEDSAAAGDLEEMFEEEDDDDAAQIPEESKISKILSDQTTKTVIILVLCLLFCLPAFTVETYLGDTVTLHDQALKHLGAIYDEFDEAPSSWTDYGIALKHL